MSTTREARPGRRGRTGLATVEEVPVWLEINRSPAVTWMCTPAALEELAIGWMHGEGYLESISDLKQLRPCATDLGFWAEVEPERVESAKTSDKQRVLASGCGAVPVYLANVESLDQEPPRGGLPVTGGLRKLFKELFASGERYQSTGGIHAAALTDGTTLLYHAEDIGRHNAVDKVIGAALLDGRDVSGMGLLVTGRISAELAFKGARAGMSYVATPSIPSNLAATIASRSGMYLVGRAVSGEPQVHQPGTAV